MYFTGKRGRKPVSLVYDAKLEPPKFNPDLASLNSSNNCASSTGGSSSVTLTPVSTFSSSSSSDKSSSFSNNDHSTKTDRFFSSENKSKDDKKTPNVVVKIGKHGETYHAKKDESDKDKDKEKDSSKESNSKEKVTPLSEEVPNNINSKPDKMETSDKKKSAATVEIKEEVGEKKSGFTTANFTESFVTPSVSVSAALIKSEATSPTRRSTSDRTSNSVGSTSPVSSAASTNDKNVPTNSTTKIKVEKMDVDISPPVVAKTTTAIHTNNSTSSSNTSNSSSINNGSLSSMSNSATISKTRLVHDSTTFVSSKSGTSTSNSISDQLPHPKLSSTMISSGGGISSSRDSHLSASGMYLVYIYSLDTLRLVSYIYVFFFDSNEMIFLY